MPAAVQPEIVPAAPKSTSSGCAVTTRTRSTSLSSSTRLLLSSAVIVGRRAQGSRRRGSRSLGGDVCLPPPARPRGPASSRCCWSGLAQAGPASAAAVAPTAVKSFGIGIDAFPRWERESSCSPTEKPGPKYLRRLLLATYGPISSNIVRPCTAADSGHEEGRALDWMTNVRVPEQKAMADAFVAWLQAPDGFGNPEAMARRLGI